MKFTGRAGAVPLKAYKDTNKGKINVNLIDYSKWEDEDGDKNGDSDFQKGGE